jgi:hypothetical protein
VTAVDRRPIRVASVPANHVYVRHLSRPGDGVVRLPDPPPRFAEARPGQWWPPAMLDPTWLRRNADTFDVFHLHFGFDAISSEHLSDVLDTLAALGKPFVYTVHDLRNPHQVDPAAHDAQLDVLVPRADALITLTPGAAAEIHRRWGRAARVIAHPHVVEFDRMARRHRAAGDEYVVGLHLKSLRANMAPLDVLPVVFSVVRELPDIRVVVDIHRDVAEVGGARHDRRVMDLLHDAARAGLVHLSIHDRFADDELWDYFESIDLSLLPYRFGTHSGWLEACHDLGTTVLAPDCGYYAQQRPSLSYRIDGDEVDPVSLAAAVRTAYAERPSWRADVQARKAERDRIADEHRALYRALWS